MTVNEHAARIFKLFRAHERAYHALHEATAALVREHGPALGLGADVIAAAAPKNPPPNEVDPL